MWEGFSDVLLELRHLGPVDLERVRELWPRQPEGSRVHPSSQNHQLPMALR